MIPRFNNKGLLPQGLIRPTIQEFKERFVDEVPSSTSRKDIYNGYRNYCTILSSLDVAALQWVDGSYTENKIDPKDIDLAIHFDGMKIYGNKALESEVKKLLDENTMKLIYKCHPQFIYIYPKNMPGFYDYYLDRARTWFKWFSRDRSGNTKGLIEFDITKDNFKSEEDYTEIRDGRGI
jgi:hypothetical protein